MGVVQFQALVECCPLPLHTPKVPWPHWLPSVRWRYVVWGNMSIGSPDPVTKGAGAGLWSERHLISNVVSLQVISWKSDPLCTWGQEQKLPNSLLGRQIKSQIGCSFCPGCVFICQEGLSSVSLLGPVPATLPSQHLHCVFWRTPNPALPPHPSPPTLSTPPLQTQATRVSCKVRGSQTRRGRSPHWKHSPSGVFPGAWHPLAKACDADLCLTLFRNRSESLQRLSDLRRGKTESDVQRQPALVLEREVGRELGGRWKHKSQAKGPWGDNLCEEGSLFGDVKWINKLIKKNKNNS